MRLKHDYNVSLGIKPVYTDEGDRENLIGVHGQLSNQGNMIKDTLKDGMKAAEIMRDANHEMFG